MKNAEIVSGDVAAKEIILQSCPGAKQIEFVNHGYHNLIAGVDSEYIFRFPRHHNSLGRFDFETELLKKIAGKIIDIQIPVVHAKSLNPAYAKLSYIPGQQLTNKQVREFTDKEQNVIAHQLVDFIRDFNKAITIDEMKALRSQITLGTGFEPWPTYLEHVFAQPQKNAKLQAIIDEYYTAWCAIDHKNQPQIIIHDDLHSGNLLFKDRRLQGVLDFEHATIGTIEQEFHYLYRQGGSVLEYATRYFEEITGHIVNIDAIRIWAVVGELAAFTRRFTANDMTHPSFLRSRAKLRHWITDFPL